MEADMVMSPCVFRPEGFDPLLSATKTAVCVVECAFLRFHYLAAALCLVRRAVHLLGTPLWLVRGLVKFVPTVASLVCLDLLGFCKH